MKEPKALKEIHDIREKMSKMSDEELLEDLKKTREKYKDLIYETEHKPKKIELTV